MAYAEGDFPTPITHHPHTHREGIIAHSHAHTVEWKESCTRRAFDDALKYLHKKLRLLLVVEYGKWCRSFPTSPPHSHTTTLALTTTTKKKMLL